MWGSQDHVNGKKATGIITLCDRERTKLAKVYWAGGTKQVYRIGAHGAFDLSIKGKQQKFDRSIHFQTEIKITP